MPNTKTGSNRWVPDIRTENIDTYTETYTPEGGDQQSQEYKLVDAHPIIGGILNKLAFFRTHAAAVWYNKLKNITVLQQLDNLASNIGTLAQLATTDKTSLVGALNELNGKMTEVTTGQGVIVSNKVTSLTGANTWIKIGNICTLNYSFTVTEKLINIHTIMNNLPKPTGVLWIRLDADTVASNTAVDAQVTLRAEDNQGLIRVNYRDVLSGIYIGTLIYQTAE